jgi:photosystem II stability/assembly factor-like uncharacterized protein
MSGRILCAASIGHAVWFSRDDGDSWRRPHTPTGGLYNEARAWCLSVHPARPGDVLTGTDQGLYRWTEAAGRWTHIPSPMDALHILKVTRSPHDPRLIVAGTRPAAIFISHDDGATWTRPAFPCPSECDFINTPRVTSIQFDPFDRETVWATVEIAGIFVSRDAGASWTMTNTGLRDVDVHNLVIFDRGRGREILASTEVGLHRSTDDGESWAWEAVPAAGEHLYFRCMAAREDRHGTLFMTVGDKPSGLVGRLLRSRDWGDSWEEVALTPRPNTTLWWIATHPDDPDLILMNGLFGEIWISRDGGEHWTLNPRQLGELRELAWAPINL